MYPATDQTYREVEERINKTVFRFKRRYGGDFQELKSQANELFMDACQSYRYDPNDPNPPVKFTTWLVTKIYLGLLHPHRCYCHDKWWKIARNEGRAISIEDRKNFRNVSDKAKFNLKSLLMEISDDAKTIVQLIAEEGHGLTWKDFLLSIGWSGKRLLEAAKEIREALEA